MHVAYSGTKGAVGRYHCRGAMLNHGGPNCIAFGALRVDQAVGTEVLRLLQPLGIEAAIQAIERHDSQAEEKGHQLGLALEQARYESALARRQYNTVDPDNRLVASELEHRWNERLKAERALEVQLEQITQRQRPPLSPQERERLLQLGADLEQVWRHLGATAAMRKRILRTVLHEIVVRVEDEQIHLVLHWQGGDHTALTVKKNKTGQHRWAVAAETEELIRELARRMPDKSIASLLNRLGKHTGRGNSWTQARVRTFRNQHGITVYREGERAERGELTLNETATRLGVSPMTVLRLIRDDLLPAHQLCRGAPWVIKIADVEHSAIKAAIGNRGKRLLTPNPDQQSLVF